MNVFSAMAALPALIRPLAAMKPVPLLVSWCLTEKCNLTCAHCAIHRNPRPEIGTREVLAVIDRLRAAGTRIISFSGGETLMRHDIAAILDYCGRRGIRTRVTSNGLLVPRKIDSIASLDVLKLSVDGTKETHEAMRGPGSFGALHAAIASASQRRMKVVFSTALTEINMKDCLFVLDLAAQHDTVATFQPLERRRGLDERQYCGLMPDIAAYRRLISFLMTEKAAGNRHIGNSLPGLYQLWRWPAPHRVACHAGKWFLHVTTEGKLLACDRMVLGINPLQDGAIESLRRIPLSPEHCEACWKNNTLELNLALSGNLSAIRNMLTWK
ncbi:MAG: radical SAM protein [Pseudomonadota bacterium]